MVGCIGPTVHFLKEKAQALGHDINESNIHCLRCPDSRGGGFDPDFGILLCANYRKSKSDVEDSLSHEMIHAYDYLRFKYDHNNLRHAACSEVSFCVFVFRPCFLFYSSFLKIIKQEEK